MMNARREYEEMYNSGGFRERYALNNGEKKEVYIRNHKCYRFFYPASHEYQDANGAIYDTVTKKWIN